MADDAPPMPPLELRLTVGLSDTEPFENRSGDPVFGDDVPAAAYRRVLDFGCGCGRLARQLLLQRDRPEAFLGLDLHKPSIAWCAKHLTRFDPAFRFAHLNVYNNGLNNGGRHRPQAFPTRESFTLVNAHSVFTHILERDVAFYLRECARRLEPGGVLRATWFLFDKASVPMMQAFQHALYINVDDPTNAVIYDAEFVRELYREAGLRLYLVRPPAVRGFQWELYARREPGEHVDFPPDEAPTGIVRAPERGAGR